MDVPPPRRHTLIFPASHTHSHGQVGAGLRMALIRPMLTVFPVVLVIVLLGVLSGHLLLAGALASFILWMVALLTRGRDRRLMAGLSGERAAHQQLRRVPDIHIYNDVMIGKENADHIILSDQGVFCIEVKNWQGTWVDHEGVYARFMNHPGQDRNRVLQQARRQSGKVAQIVRHKVLPVVVFTHPSARVRVRELDGVTVCSLATLAPTLTRLRREAQYPLTPQQFDLIQERMNLHLLTTPKETL